MRLVLIWTSLLLCLAAFVPQAQLAASSDWRYAAAVNWAEQQAEVGSTNYGQGLNTLCGQFVANAYGAPAAGYDTAYLLFLAIGTASSALPPPDVPGLLVFFEQNAGNRNFGHVGLYVGSRSGAVGSDWMISVTSGGVRWNRVSDWDAKYAKFIGWADPPNNWPGRTDSSPGPMCTSNSTPPFRVVIPSLSQDPVIPIPVPTPTPSNQVDVLSAAPIPFPRSRPVTAHVTGEAGAFWSGNWTFELRIREYSDTSCSRLVSIAGMMGGPATAGSYSLWYPFREPFPDNIVAVDFVFATWSTQTSPQYGRSSPCIRIQ